jgi:hypothetical protein
MSLGAILSLINVALDVFKDERKDRFLKQYVKIKTEYQNELDKGLANRSDLTISQLLNEAKLLSALVVAEHNK